MDKYIPAIFSIALVCVVLSDTVGGLMARAIPFIIAAWLGFDIDVETIVRYADIWGRYD